MRVRSDVSGDVVGDAEGRWDEGADKIVGAAKGKTLMEEVHSVVAVVVLPETSSSSLTILTKPALSTVSLAPEYLAVSVDQTTF